jgi:hypothetical protein
MSRAGTGPQSSPAAGAPDPGADGLPATAGPIAGQRTGSAPARGADAGTARDAAEDAGPAGVARLPRTGWDPALRAAGVVIAIVAAFLSGVLELFLTTLRAGDLTGIWRGAAIGSGSGPLLGVSILLAAVLNYAIAWFVVSTSGRRWVIGPPWALWTLMMLFAAGVRTDEGDYLLGGENWVALVMILVGSLTYAVYCYRMIIKRIPR